MFFDLSETSVILIYDNLQKREPAGQSHLSSEMQLEITSYSMLHICHQQQRARPWTTKAYIRIQNCKNL